MGKLILPKQVELLLGEFKRNGHEAYAVGSCIRDSIMGITPHRWNLCTSAAVDEILDVLEEYDQIDTNKSSGVVTVTIDGINCEIATYKGSNLLRDLIRRDFTINAIAYDQDNGFIDFCGGMKDISKKVIRCIKDPDERFREDTLQILRAIRLAVRLNFNIETTTRNSMRKYSGLLKDIPPEKIYSELVQILSEDLSGRVELLELMLELIKECVPEFKNINSKNICKRLEESIHIPELRLAILLDLPVDHIDSVADRLKIPKNTVNLIKNTLGYGMKIDEYMSELLSNRRVALGSNSYESSMRRFVRKVLCGAGYDVAMLATEYVLSFWESCQVKSKILHDLELVIGIECLNHAPISLERFIYEYSNY